MVGKGGVVRDSFLHDMVVKDLSSFFKKTGFLIESVIPSELQGPKGNREFFISLRYDEQR
jgi:23S rRNA (cytidine1920-2'-O)/16S rRNA (cytidine1409-2'-O)-methyltransferase